MMTRIRNITAEMTGNTNDNNNDNNNNNEAKHRASSHPDELAQATADLGGKEWDASRFI